jgi:DNA topoisomerase VI subunit A
MNLVLLGLLLLFHQSYTLASTPNALREEFSESLKIRPTPDGKLYTHFEFRTLLREASPRDPRTLDLEDEGTPLYPIPSAITLIQSSDE